VTRDVPSGTLLLISRPATAIQASRPGVQPQPSEITALIEGRELLASATDGLGPSSNRSFYLNPPALWTLFDGTASSMQVKKKIRVIESVLHDVVARFPCSRSSLFDTIAALVIPPGNAYSRRPRQMPSQRRPRRGGQAFNLDGGGVECLRGALGRR